MNKIQLLVMWVGIALFLLLIIFPPHKWYYSPGESNIHKGIVNKELQRTFLIAITLVAGGLIVTFRDKNKSDKAWQLLTAFWQKLTKYAFEKNINKRPKDEQKQ